MDLTQLANLGEFIGGVAVLVTLVYLATELRRSRMTTETAAVSALTSMVNPMNADLYTNRDFMELVVRAHREPSALDGVDRARFVSYTQSAVNHVISFKRSYDARMLPDKEWRVFAAAWANFFDSPGVEWALGQVAIPDDVRSVLREYRNDPSQYAAMKGVE